MNPIKLYILIISVISTLLSPIVQAQRDPSTQMTEPGPSSRLPGIQKKTDTSILQTPNQNDDIPDKELKNIPTTKGPSGQVFTGSGPSAAKDNPDA